MVNRNTLLASLMAASFAADGDGTPDRVDIHPNNPRKQ
jgi:hypothetical protein